MPPWPRCHVTGSVVLKPTCRSAVALDISQCLPFCKLCGDIGISQSSWLPAAWPTKAWEISPHFQEPRVV